MSSSSHHAKDLRAVVCAVLTVSDTRQEANDESGACLRDLLRAAGHTLGWYGIRRDEPDEVVAAISGMPPEVRAVLVNGGTGISPRDTTFDAVARLLDKPLPGFGELFRMLSYEQIGAVAMLSRATAGIAGRRVVFSMPGSRAAVELAATKLILPSLGHVVALLGDGK